MLRSSERILTTHVGCLQRPLELVEAMRQGGTAPDAALRGAVADVVRKQAEVGIDVPNDGEFGKSIWHWYIFDRLNGFERRPWQEAYFVGRDRDRYRAFYEWADSTWRDAPGGPTGELFYGHDEFWVGSLQTQPVCTSPVTYRPEAVQRDIANLQAALQEVQVAEAFYPSVAPASIEVGVGNEHYASGRDLLDALVRAMREEYLAIVDAGFVLQVDDAWIPALWDHEADIEWETYRAFCIERIDALNQALEGIPEDRIRYHICWGSWHGPHSADIPLPDIADLMLRVKAGAYVFEAANVRHAHEYHLWERVKLPDGKIIIPGVVTHSTNLIEHPELVAERIGQFAERVGRENVIAGTDCGMGARIHPELGWGKLEALVQGAELASRALWGSAAGVR